MPCFGHECSAVVSEERRRLTRRCSGLGSAAAPGALTSPLNAVALGLKDDWFQVTGSSDV